MTRTLHFIFVFHCSEPKCVQSFERFDLKMFLESLKLNLISDLYCLLLKICSLLKKKKINTCIGENAETCVNSLRNAAELLKSLHVYAWKCLLEYNENWVSTLQDRSVFEVLLRNTQWEILKHSAGKKNDIFVCVKKKEEQETKNRIERKKSV